MNANTLIPQTAQEPKLQGCTNLKLRQLTRRITQHYDAELAHAGLKITQYSLMSHLVTLGPLGAGELAARIAQLAIAHLRSA